MANRTDPRPNLLLFRGPERDDRRADPFETVDVAVAT